MKIDNCIKNFLEKYDREAMSSIDDLSNTFGLVINKRTMPLFNIVEAFNAFNDCLVVYGKYQTETAADKKLAHDDTVKNTLKFIEEKVFDNKDVLYKDLPSFVASYTEGVKKILNTIEEVKGSINESGIDPEYSADINTFSDKFIEIMDKKFTESMDKILMASGYTNRKRMYMVAKKPIFI